MLIGASKTKLDIDTKGNEFLLELESYAGCSNYDCRTTPMMKFVRGLNEFETSTGYSSYGSGAYRTDIDRINTVKTENEAVCLLCHRSEFPD